MASTLIAEQSRNKAGISTGNSPLHPRVDESIANAPDFAQPVLIYLRNVVHEAAPDATEEIKWARPFFSVNGTILCHMAAFKNHCGFGFWSPEMTAMLQADGVDGTSGSGSLGKIRSLDDLPHRSDLLRYIRHAAERARTGIVSPVTSRVRTSAKAAIPVPPELAAALSKSVAARTAFEQLPPSCRREYLEWITTAKRPETRARRIADTATMLGAGKRFKDRGRTT